MECKLEWNGLEGSMVMQQQYRINWKNGSDVECSGMVVGFKKLRRHLLMFLGFQFLCFTILFFHVSNYER